MASPSSVETGNFQLISSLRYDPDLAKAAKTTDDAYPHPQDSPYYLLSYHYDRLLSSAKTFGWERAIETLEKLSSHPEHEHEHDNHLANFSQALDVFIPDKAKTWRLRISLSIGGAITVEPTPMPSPFNHHTLLLPPPSQIPSPPSFSTLSPPESNTKLWHLYLDTKHINPSAFTTHKTTARDMYQDAGFRTSLSTAECPADVLVYNSRGEVMEGSITTPYFRRRKASIGSSDNNNNNNNNNNSQVGDVGWITPPLSSGGNDGTTRRYALLRGFCVVEVIKTSDIVDGEECWLSNGVRGFMKAVVVLNRASEP